MAQGERRGRGAPGQAAPAVAFFGHEVAEEHSEPGLGRCWHEEPLLSGTQLSCHLPGAQSTLPPLRTR